MGRKLGLIGWELGDICFGLIWYLSLDWKKVLLIVEWRNIKEIVSNLKVKDGMLP